MLKATINCNKKIDISKFPKLIGFLKSKNNGYRPKKSAVLEREEICKFLAEADDEMYLLIKTVMIVGIAGACRTDAFCKINLADITNHGQYVIIKITQTKNDIPRSFTIVENPDGERVSYVNYYFPRNFCKLLSFVVKGKK
jgi:integrase